MLLRHQSMPLVTYLFQHGQTSQFCQTVLRSGESSIQEHESIRAFFSQTTRTLVCVQSLQESLLGLNLVTFSCFLIYIPLLRNRIWMEQNLEKIDIVLHMEESEYTDKNYMWT